MKKILKVLTVISFLYIMTGCNQSEQHQDNDQSDFNLITKKMAFVKGDYSSDYFSFSYLGTITNLTKNIYKKATITMTLNFQLENGDVLTDVDMAASKNTFGAAEAFDIVEMYKPNQQFDMQELKTELISVDYAKYPIKSVTLDFTIELVDEINNTNNVMAIKSEDITDKWLAFVDDIKSDGSNAHETSPVSDTISPVPDTINIQH